METSELVITILLIIVFFLIAEIVILFKSNKQNEESKKRIDKIFDNAQIEQKKTLRKFGLISMIVALISNFFIGNNSNDENV